MINAEDLLYLFRNLGADGHCIVWRGLQDRDGYGIARWGLRRDRAHRFVWQLTRGPIPSGLLVLHHCDNPPCVNPDHLWLGTDRDNVHDAIAKGHWGRGRQVGGAKLTEAQVVSIRLHPERRARELSAELGVSTHTIRSVRAMRTWQHLVVAL